VRTRPPVVVYVTREHPRTGADQLLVLDAAALPGEAVLEETGIEVRVLRELGESAGSTFLHATPVGSTPDEWEHRHVRCRWVPLHAELGLRGGLGARLEDLIRQRVVAYVTRERDGRAELLTIEHGDIPDLGVQVPAGRLDPGEDPATGLHREVEEETGVAGLEIVRQLADGEEFERLYGKGAHESFAFHAVAEAGGPDEWEHPVTGTGADAGFTYLCRWVPLRADFPLWGRPDPLLERLIRSI
jgi:ADP-ribose pyrophosphatase YjhB (NUDIX family)